MEQNLEHDVPVTVVVVRPSDQNQGTKGGTVVRELRGYLVSRYIRYIRCGVAQSPGGWGSVDTGL